jgi:hypothetical protein
MTLDSVVVGNRVFTNGDEEIVMRFSPVRAKHVLIKIDAADSPANNAVVTEFEVFTADPSEVCCFQLPWFSNQWCLCRDWIVPLFFDRSGRGTW